jgi:hypothetical protein
MKLKALKLLYLSISLMTAQVAVGSGAFAYGEQDMVTSLKTPLIPGAPNGAAWQQPYEGDAPAIGDGNSPLPVVPGHSGSPEVPPSDIAGVPLTMGGDKETVDNYVMPYLTPPPSTPGFDAGYINGSSGGYGLNAPVQVVNIGPNGGMAGNAPTQHWGGQRTFDYGRANCVRPNSSRLIDYGAKLSQKPDLKMTPQFSEDGPMPGGGIACNGRNLPSSQATQDLYGNRTFFKGENLRSRSTIAPY